MKALIFAAGLGTRLQPYTQSIPKALVAVNGKPLLEHLLLKLKASGFTQVVINVHHFADKIISFLDENSNFGLDIYISDERSLLLETGGGIKHAEALLNDNEPFLVHNVDILSNLNLEEFYESFLASSISVDTPLASIVLSDRLTQRYLVFDSSDNLVAWCNTSTGEIKSPFWELCRKPDICNDNANKEVFNLDKFLLDNKLHKRAFSGIHVVSPAIFPLMQKWPSKFSIIDFYLSIADKYNIRSYCRENFKMVDVGKPESLAQAELFCREDNY